MIAALLLALGSVAEAQTHRVRLVVFPGRPADSATAAIEARLAAALVRAVRIDTALEYVDRQAELAVALADSSRSARPRLSGPVSYGAAVSVGRVESGALVARIRFLDIETAQPLVTESSEDFSGPALESMVERALGAFKEALTRRSLRARPVLRERPN